MATGINGSASFGGKTYSVNSIDFNDGPALLVWAYEIDKDPFVTYEVSDLPWLLYTGKARPRNIVNRMLNSLRDRFSTPKVTFNLELADVYKTESSNL